MLTSFVEIIRFFTLCATWDKTRLKQINIASIIDAVSHLLTMYFLSILFVMSLIILLSFVPAAFLRFCSPLKTFTLATITKIVSPCPGDYADGVADFKKGAPALALHDTAAVFSVTPASRAIGPPGISAA